MSSALLASLLKALKLTLLPPAKLMFDHPKNVSVHLITVAGECISSNLVSTQLCLCAHSRWVVIFFLLSWFFQSVKDSHSLQTFNHSLYKGCSSAICWWLKLDVSKSATPTINEVLKGRFHFDVIYQDIIRCYFVVKYNSLPYFCGCLAA